MRMHRTGFCTGLTHSDWTPAKRSPQVITLAGEIFDTYSLSVPFVTGTGNQRAENANYTAYSQSNMKQEKLRLNPG